MADKWAPVVVQDALDLDWAAFKEKYGDSFTSYDGWRRKKYDALNGRLPASVASDVVVPAPRKAEFNGPLRLNYADALILSDLHCPFHNDLMLRRAFWLRKQKQYRHIDTALIAGDVFNFEVISRHGIQGPYVSLDDEFTVVRRVLRSFAVAGFKKVYCTLGNHDRRLSKKLDAALNFQVMVDGALGAERGNCEFIATDLDYMFLDHPAGEERSWIIGHPSGYSGQGGKTPSDYAMVYHRNVMTGHNHVVGESQSRCGRYVGVDLGHMTAPDSHHYLMRSMTSYARWNAGFAYISDGYHTRYTEKWTNWPALGC